MEANVYVKGNLFSCGIYCIIHCYSPASPQVDPRDADRGYVICQTLHPVLDHLSESHHQGYLYIILMSKSHGEGWGMT